MKNLKKLVSVIVTVAMLISSLAALSVGAATGQYGDVQESSTPQAISKDQKWSLWFVEQWVKKMLQKHLAEAHLTM